MPDFFHELWEIYILIRRQTSGGFNGPNPISLSDLSLYHSVFDESFQPWKQLMLLDADSLFMSAVAERQRKEADRTT